MQVVCLEYEQNSSLCNDTSCKGARILSFRRQTKKIMTKYLTCLKLKVEAIFTTKLVKKMPMPIHIHLPECQYHHKDGNQGSW